MANEEIFKPMLELQKIFPIIIQREFGHLLSAHIEMRINHGDPSQNVITRNRVKGVVQGLLLVYLFSIWDEYISELIEKEWLESSEKVRLDAFRHVRNSIAHGALGGRAKKKRDEFEIVMNSSEPFPNIQWTQDTIDLTSAQVAYDCYVFMNSLKDRIIGRIANNNPIMS